LNNRYWTGKDPVRIVIDRTLKTPRHYHLWNGATPTLFVTAEAAGQEGGTETVTTDFGKPLLPQLMQLLHERRILSVLVEGGPYVLNEFIEAGLWDEARVIIGSHSLPDGVKSPVLSHSLLTTETLLDGDRILYYRNRKEGTI
jgi:diaminohydroxyphosphoribosylaminopyrimidine deaminase/5-amino-6-(5-phosphoribosylamino)uracil reductase